MKSRKPSAKKRTSSGMRDKYWKQLLQLVENRRWDEFAEYIERHQWLATAPIARALLPDYLVGDKEYGLLRLLCNVEDVPVWVVQGVIGKGARDKQGRAYLERLLVGQDVEQDQGTGKQVENVSPAVAAAVLCTAERPAEVIERMHKILEQGLVDEHEERRSLAEKCIDRSRLFYDLLMLLYEHEAQGRLVECLQSTDLLEAAMAGQLNTYGDVESLLAGK